MDIQIILKELNYNYIHKSLQIFHRQQKKILKYTRCPVKFQYVQKKINYFQKPFDAI
jgi:hypothetical protein